MKRIVFDSPLQHSATAVGVGIEFERGVPQSVTDEQAAILLETYTNATLDPNDPKSPRNPNFGKQKHPHFRLESEAQTPYQKEHGIVPAAPSEDSQKAVEVNVKTALVTSTAG